MPTVYITQAVTGRDFNPARQFGELVTLTPHTSQVVLTAEPMIELLKSKLRDIKPSDYILLSGDPVIIGLALAVALHCTGGKVKLLKWDRRLATYQEVDVEVNYD